MKAQGLDAGLIQQITGLRAEDLELL